MGAAAAGGDLTDLPDEAWVVALASLPDVGPTRLAALLAGRPPREAFAEVAAGRGHRHAAGAMGADPAALARRWARTATSLDVSELWQAHVEGGVGVATAASVAYPAPFAGDPHPPSLVVWRGDPAVLDGPRVAVVGTRDCTRQGYDIAREMGRELSAAGVRVVSGLALGIDGAAHAGALEAGGAPPVGVVAGGLDVVYPRRHARLWHEVAEAGLLLSEWPLGTPLAPWRFPARNRLIAALADVVVVVESHDSGGSLSTAAEAGRRQRVVMAVPGSLRSPASEGTNGLLADGIEVCLGPADVLVALGLVAATTRVSEERPPPRPGDGAVLDALGWQPASVEQLMVRTGRPLGELAGALARLEEGGWVVARGGWFERVPAQPSAPPARRPARSRRVPARSASRNPTRAQGGSGGTSPGVGDGSRYRGRP